MTDFATYRKNVLDATAHGWMCSDEALKKEYMDRGFTPEEAGYDLDRDYEEYYADREDYGVDPGD